MVVFDCCREDLVGAKERVVGALNKMKFEVDIESVGKMDQSSDSVQV